MICTPKNRHEVSLFYFYPKYFVLGASSVILSQKEFRLPQGEPADRSRISAMCLFAIEVLVDNSEQL